MGCAACESVVTHGRVIGSSHTEECRIRIGNLLARDDAGLERLRRYNLRTEEDEAPPPEAGATAGRFERSPLGLRTLPYI